MNSADSSLTAAGVLIVIAFFLLLCLGEMGDKSFKEKCDKVSGEVVHTGKELLCLKKGSNLLP